MTVTYVGAGSTVTSTSTGPATLAVPSGAVVGDILIAYATGKCQTDGVIPEVDIPPGWTEAGTIIGDFPSSPRELYLGVWFKRYAASGDPTVFTFPGAFIGSSLRGWAMRVTAWRGIINPGLASTIAYDNAAPLSPFTPGSPTLDREATVFSVVSHASTAGPTLDTANGFVRRSTVGLPTALAFASIAADEDTQPAGTAIVPDWAVGTTSGSRIAGVTFALASTRSGRLGLNTMRIGAA